MLQFVLTNKFELDSFDPPRSRPNFSSFPVAGDKSRYYSCVSRLNFTINNASERRFRLAQTQTCTENSPTNFQSNSHSFFSSLQTPFLPITDFHLSSMREISPFLYSSRPFVSSEFASNHPAVITNYQILEIAAPSSIFKGKREEEEAAISRVHRAPRLV